MKITEKEAKNKMREYLILLKLNPSKLMDTLGSLRQLGNKPTDGVNLCYTINVFGVWDIGMWINAEESTQVLEFVQKKVKHMTGITEVYTIPTFPHGNKMLNAKDEVTNSNVNEPIATET